MDEEELARETDWILKIPRVFNKGEAESSPKNATEMNTELPMTTNNQEIDKNLTGKIYRWQQ